MKNFLALIIISISLFVFLGCNGETTEPTTTDELEVSEEDITPEIEINALPEGVEVVSNEDRKKALDEKAARALEADVQILEDQKKLDKISATRPLRVEDCELVQNPDFKESCLEFASVEIEEE